MSAGSDTEMSTESSSESRGSGSSGSSWGGDSRDSSPRDDCGAAAAAPQPPAPAGRRVPPLSLRANLAALPRADSLGYDGGIQRPGTARQTGGAVVPRLALPGAAAAGRSEPACAGVPSPALTRSPPSPPCTAEAGTALQQQQCQPQQQQGLQSLQQRQQQQQQPGAVAIQATPLSLDILSPAFSLEEGSNSSSNSREHLVQRCASQLGVPSERLRYYALVEVASPDDLPPGCTRAAVEVLGSSFSLAALEELVAENQRLKAAVGAGEAHEQQPQQQSERWQTGTAAAASRAAEAQAHLRQLQLETETLRRQLQQSESLRRKGFKTLQDLKHDFDALSRALMISQACGLVLGKHPLVALSPCERQEAMGTPAAVSDALQEL